MKTSPAVSIVMFVVLTGLGGVLTGALSYGYVMGVIVSAAVIGLMAEMNKAGSRRNPPVV